MEFWFLIIASSISLIGMLFHGIVGQQKYMGNINKSALEPLTKSLSLVSWHIFTVFLFVSFASCVLVAFNKVSAEILYPIISTNLLGSFLFVALGLTGHKVLLQMPGSYLMGFTALFAYMAI